MITGSETSRQKDVNKLAFINGESNLLLLSLRSGEGIDGLQTRSSIVVFGEIDWSPQIHHQIIGRLHRFGQQDSVLAMFLLSKEGSDPLMEQILDIKSEQCFKLMNPNQRYIPDLDTQAGKKRVQDIAQTILQQYEIDLEKARLEFEVKEPPSYWTLLATLENFIWDRECDEKKYQAELHQFLLALGTPIEREVHVNGGIIDFLTSDGIGIEIKLNPVARPALVRQIREYIQDDNLRAMIVINADPVNPPPRLYGKQIKEIDARSNTVISALEA